MKTLLTVFFFLLYSIVNCQSLSLFDVDASNFPTIRAKFYAFDTQGIQQRPNISDLSISENGIPCTITNVSCPAPKPQQALSSVLVIDVSGSMGSQTGTETNIDIAKAGANAWVNLLPFGSNECAIVSFDDKNYLNQDFTSNKDKLKNAISKLKPNSGTSYDAAFINEKAGGLLVSKTGKYQKVIVFLTDGQAAEPKTQEIIDEAKRQNCIIFCITIGINASSSLKRIASETGGVCFENLQSIKEAETIFTTVLRISQGSGSCIISWESDNSCRLTTIITELKHSLTNANAYSNYDSPEKSISHLDFSPDFIMLKNLQIGVPYITTVSVTAKNQKFEVANITSSNSAFTISPSTFTLLENESIDLTITITPSDSNYIFTKFSFENNECLSHYFASIWYDNNTTAQQNLKVTFPNGGEKFIAGSDTLISWEGIAEHELVRLEYSTNNGMNWNYIDTTRGLQYKWTNIPKNPSKECLIKVSLLGNSVLDTVQTLRGHTHQVKFVTFSPDGKLLASLGWDDRIRIWDVNTGNLLKSKSGADWYINFSNDGKYLVTGSWDKTVKIWDVETMNVIKSFEGHTERWVLSTSFNHDGSKIASGSYDNTVKIWDVSTNTLMHTFSDHNSPVNCVKFSPDGSLLASAGTDQRIRIWDVLTGQLIRTLYAPSNAIWTNTAWSIDFSHDGKTLTSSWNDSTVKIWEVNTGKLINTFRGHIKHVRRISNSPNGLFVASGGWDRILKLWDLSSGMVIKNFIGHKDEITGVSFSPFNDKIATCSEDSTIKIWKLDLNTIQSDQSDSVFSIVEPLGASTDIAMGEVLLGDDKDSVVVDFVRNVGSWNFDVRSVSFRGADAGAFSLVSGIPQYRVEPNSSHFGEFRFTPSRVGLHQAEVVIITQSDTIVQNISGIGVDLQLQIHATFIDFGEVEVGNERTIIDTLVLKNVGTNPITIDDTKLLSPDVEQFAILSGGGNFTLGVGEERLVTVQFKPKYIGRTSGRIGFEYAGIGSPAIANLFGNGIGGLVYVPNDSGYVGDRKSIQLMLGKMKPDVIASIAPKFKATLRLHNNHLAPINKNNVTMQNDSLYINLQGSIGSTSLLAEFPVLVGLGNVDYSWIDIVDFDFLDASGNPVNYDFEMQNGSFKTLGICYEGGIRLINSTTPVPLLTVSPNPSDGKVEIEVNLIEDGVSSLKIYNSAGFLIEEMGFSSSGSRTIELDTKRYSNGLYFITIETPTQFDKTKCLLVK
jgi:WD40 repeat protein